MHVRLLLLGTLAVTLGIDLGSEGAERTVSLASRIGQNAEQNLLLPLQGKPVHHKDLGSQKKTSYLALVQSNAEEVQGASPVHGRASHVEREAGDGCIHENAKVVAEVGTSDAESPHARQNQDRAGNEQDTTDDRLVHRSVEGLLIESDLVDMVTQNSQRENRESQEIASFVGPTEDAG